MNSLRIAYTKIFHDNQEKLNQLDKLEDWEIAKEVLSNFNGGLLDQKLAEDVIYECVLFVKYPDKETTTEVVGLAERLATEIIPEFNLPNKEPNMDEIEHLYRSRGLEG